MSWQFTPTMPSFTSPFALASPPQLMVEDNNEFEEEKLNLECSVKRET